MVLAFVLKSQGPRPRRGAGTLEVHSRSRCNTDAAALPHGQRDTGCPCCVAALCGRVVVATRRAEIAFGAVVTHRA